MSDRERIVTWLDDWLAGGGRVLLLTDYDGTLTPIVANPADATLPLGMRRQLEALTKSPLIDVAVVSGRDLADLRERVGLSDVIYAGCHGLEIEGPGLSFRHPEAEAQEAALRVISRELSQRAPIVPGMHVEPKRFGLAIHYRHVAPDQMAQVESELARAIQQCGGRLRIFHGSQVIEIQPQVGWNKGDCVLWIRDVLKGSAAEPVLMIYMGDDWTDENAFEALSGQGITIRVGASVPASRAAYRLPDVTDVQTLLQALAERVGTGSER
ncbi:MAG: trehalose-phosphatase [Candidatus Rokuibacteriota bacterium]|nr:MAG: trehalose-phosphatase [Candidatus Rokubacteria bacterium]